MADKTGIEWTDATWNPVTGCTEVSLGCDHCYAKTFAERWRGTPGHYFENGFDVQLRPDKLELPLRWRRPRRIFVNSMSDLFHDQVSDEYIAKVFAVMAVAHRHTFQVLTKRHARMRSLLSRSDFRELMFHCSPGFEDGNGGDSAGDWIRTEAPWPLPNIWLGVSAENQRWADIRIPALLDTPAAVRFVSAEPLLGPIDLCRYLSRWGDCPTCDGAGSVLAPGGGRACPDCAYDDRAGREGGIDWVIAGGESGPGARPMHPDWARGLRDQCQNAGVAFLFKQWGEYRPATMADGWEQIKHVCAKPRCAAMWRAGKKAAGRELDGRTWDEYPQAVIHA